jgi:hypothetical protein
VCLSYLETLARPNAPAKGGIFIINMRRFFITRALLEWIEIEKKEEEFAH